MTEIRICFPDLGLDFFRFPAEAERRGCEEDDLHLRDNLAEAVLPPLSGPNSRPQIGAVDAVYTWVNGSDPHFRLQVLFHRALQLITAQRTSPPWLQQQPEQAEELREAGQSRFRELEQLKFSFRSLFKFAPWLRR